MVHIFIPLYILFDKIEKLTDVTVVGVAIATMDIPAVKIGHFGVVVLAPGPSLWTA